MYALMYMYALKGGGMWCIVCICVDGVMWHHHVTCTYAQCVCPRVLFDVLEHSITLLICVYILYVYVKE